MVPVPVASTAISASFDQPFGTLGDQPRMRPSSHAYRNRAGAARPPARTTNPEPPL